MCEDQLNQSPSLGKYKYSLGERVENPSWMLELLPTQNHVQGTVVTTFLKYSSYLSPEEKAARLTFPTQILAVVSIIG